MGTALDEVAKRVEKSLVLAVTWMMHVLAWAPAQVTAALAFVPGCYPIFSVLAAGCVEDDSICAFCVGDPSVIVASWVR